MKKDVSKKTVIVLLLLALVISIAGTWFVLDGVNTAGEKMMIGRGTTTANAKLVIGSGEESIKSLDFSSGNVALKIK